MTILEQKLEDICNWYMPKLRKASSFQQFVNIYEKFHGALSNITDSMHKEYSGIILPRQSEIDNICRSKYEDTVYSDYWKYAIKLPQITRYHGDVKISTFLKSYGEERR